MIAEWLTSFLERVLEKKKHEVYRLRWRKAELERIKIRINKN